MHAFTETALFAEGRAPRVFEPGAGERDLAAFVAARRDLIEERLLEHGALLFRGFEVASVADFEGFGEAVSPRALDYTYRSTPRSSVGKGVFTATEYPPDQEIALHCENAYQRDWPLKVAFCCLVAPQSGGETPIADMRRVAAAIGEERMDRFEARGVRYVRHYRPYVDIPWETVFQTSDRGEVARFCEANGIVHEWLDAQTLRTAQTNHGTARHPLTGERVFFNQAHLFHVSNLGAEVAASLLNMFGADRLPRHAYYGDGGEIAAEDLQAVREAFAGASIRFPWQVGDVMLLDNMQMAHGRKPFSGARKIVASLLDAYSERASSEPVPAAATA
ncbi:TauD/TfdA family dioxygenase [Lysobacter sp. 1R34A]|uniref:TauD/TfdA family dioxygenase n=1 Tax=Lysobacter sp. 1R34A TaxID=3445786 RepID=UPI003EEFD29D